MNSNRRNIGRFFRTAARETCSFYFCKRVGSFFLVWLFYLYIYMKPVRNFSVIRHYPAAPWGILFAFSGLYFNLVLMAGAIYLFSKVPFMEREQMYRFVRLGKNKWILVQVIKIFSVSFFYTLTVICSGILIMLPRLEWNTEWGKLYYTLALTNAQENSELMFDISYHLINDYKPIPLLFLSAFVITLIVSFTGLLMFLISLCFTRMAAVIAGTFLAIAPIAVENADRRIQRVMVSVVPTEWMKITKAGVKNILGVLSPGFDDIIFRLMIMILVIVIIICLCGYRASYDWYGEE